MYRLVSRYIASTSVLCLLFFAIVSAQPAGKGLPLITNYYDKLNTGTNQVWSVVSDDQGLFYFGSFGVTIYDGVSWRKVASHDSIARGVLRSLAKDEQGRILYGCPGDLGFLDKDSTGQEFFHSLLRFIPDSAKNFNDIWSICVTAAGIYFQSRSRIFLFTEHKNSREEKWSVKMWSPATRFMHAFYLNGDYFVHQQEKGLYRLQQDSLVLIPGSEFLGAERMQLMLPYVAPGSSAATTSSNEFLVGMFYSGLFHFDGKTFTPFITDVDSILKTNILYKGILMNDGNYALATKGKGVIIINSSGRLIQQIGREEGINDGSVYGMYQDKAGDLWLTLDNGISKLETGAPYSIYNDKSGIISTPLNVRKFENRLYVGTTSGMVCSVPNTNRFERIPGTPTGNVFNVAIHNGQLYFGADGLYTIKNSKAYLVRRSISGDMQISCLLFSKRYDDVLICGTSYGLCIFTRNYKKVPVTMESWDFLGYIKGADRTIYSSNEENDGTVWGNTGNGTIYRVLLPANARDRKDLSKYIITTFTERDAFGGGNISRIRGELYFAFDSVFKRFDKKQEIFYRDTSLFKGRSDKDNLAAIEDDSGKVWTYLNKKARLFTPLQDGTYSEDSTRLLCLTDNSITDVYSEGNGVTWIASNRQLIRFDQEIKTNNSVSYGTIIRSVIANQKLLPLPASGKGAGAILGFTNNSLRFDYAAPFFTQEQKTRYQTWLEGFEKTWTAWGNNPYKEYTNLPEGHYTFHVRALNFYDRISEEDVYRFVVNPPWYREWWAYAVMVILAAGIIWAIIFYRYQSLRRANRLLEEKIEQRTFQLSKSLNELKSTQEQLIQQEKMASLGELTAGIAHEIQNPLNFVNNFSEVNTELLEELKSKKLTVKIKEEELTEMELLNDIIENEKKINQHGKRAASIVKGMLQHSHSSAGEKELVDVNQLADEYLRLAYHGVRARDSSFQAAIHTEFDDTCEPVNIITQDIGRVLLNLYTNAFYAVHEKHKHSLNEYQPAVTVKTKNCGGKVVVSVKDNGDGVPSPILDKIFQPFFTTKPPGEGTGLGLSLAYDIVTREHSGSLKVRNLEEGGAEFVIELSGIK